MIKDADVIAQLEIIERNMRYSAKLINSLELDGSPAAVAITEEPFKELENLKSKITVCMMAQSARRGAAFCTPGDSITCGGRANLGVGKSPIRSLDNLLLCKARFFKSIHAASNVVNSAKRWATKHGEYVTFSPLEKANFLPDVVLFAGTPEQMSRIIYLHAYDKGEMDSLYGEPLCTGTIAMPITSGKIGISFLDMACRLFGRYRAEEMVIGVPYYKIPQIVDNIDLSSAGTAKPARFLKLAGKVLTKRAPANF